MPLFPNVVGLTVDEACTTTRERGFTATPSVTPKGYKNAWDVIDQTPAAGTEQSASVNIDLSVRGETTAQSGE